MRRKPSRLTLEQLERRELFAGDFMPTLVSPPADGFCGPLPLEPKVVATSEPTTPPPVEDGEAVDLWEQYGFGNIEAHVVDGTLVIRGDAKKNHVTLFAYYGGEYSTDPAGTIVLNAGWATKVNGIYLHTTELMERHAQFTGVTAIDIDLGDGDDMVEVHAVKVPSLTVRTGNGEDWVNLKGTMPSGLGITRVYNPNPGMQGPMGYWDTVPQPLQVEGDLFIDTGAGNDRLMPFASVSGDATVQMGDGDDSYIEVPHHWQDELSIRPVVIGDVGWYRGPRYVSGKLTAAGTLTIDMGADQDAEIIPDDWRSDPVLLQFFSGTAKVLEFYRGMIERGEATPGTEQIIRPPYPYDVPARIDAEGRLAIEFGFTPGFRRVIERLQARGVVLEAYSINRGVARALVGVDDLKLFANLPGLGFGSGWSYLYENANFSLQIDPEWDYIRPGSKTAELFVELPPRPDAPPPRNHNPSTIIIVGPVQPDQVRVREEGDLGSLVESYYGNNNALIDLVTYGPQQ